MWKFASLWHPDMVKGVFSVCTPYAPPQPAGTEYLGAEALVERVPNFRYQLQLGGTEMEEYLAKEGLVEEYLGAVFGAKAEDGKGPLMTPEGGVEVERLRGVKGGGRLVTGEEWEVYRDAL